jgi:hypothetical protein
MKDFNFPNLGRGTWIVGYIMLTLTFGILAGLALIPVFMWYERRRLELYIETRTRLGKAIREEAIRNATKRNGETS